MSENSYRRLLERSREWISQHWNASNLDVPDEFLESWIYAGDEDATRPSGFQFAVFSFGYIRHEMIANHVPEGAERSFSTSRMLELFQAWQLKLGLVELHRASDLRFHPMPLFAFPRGEQIRAWRVSSN